MKPGDTGSKLSLLFDPEDEIDMFLQNYMALHSRRLYSSYRNRSRFLFNKK
jgi:hypothetical protein